MDFSQEYWNAEAAREAIKNCGVGYQNVKSPCNVFILDTSSSVGKDGFAQMKEALCIIIDEYAKQDIKENVAVVVCGRHTKFLRYYSNHYEDIKQSLDEVELGGPSPLTAAFFLSLACVKYGGDRIHRIGAFCLNPRIILISDGRPTSFTDPAGSFVEDSPQYETANDKDHLLQLTRTIGKISPIFCIPVGRNPDTTTLEFISGQSRGGKIVCVPEARQFAKYSLNIRTASMLSFTMENDGNDKERILTSLACKFPDKVFTELDQKDIFEICSRKYLYQSVSGMEDEIDDKESPFVEKYPQMPRLGSRVKRGRDWMYDDHDNYGPGTVVGHLAEGTLLVEWDTGFKSDYRFGAKSKLNDKYDVQLCNEPRILVNELIATGCLVTRGKDWIWGNQDGGAGNIGSVISVQSSGLVFVRWQHGFIGNYKFGADGCFELKISDPFLPKAIQFLQDQVKNTPFDSSSGPRVDIDGNHERSNTTNASSEKISESVKTTSLDLVNRPILHVTKRKYFKNNSVVEKATPDVETDGPTFTCAMNQWWWKDCEGKWNPYSREVNERINKCYNRDPKSTVIVNIQDQSYRVVMSKNRQINQTTRDISEIKLVTNWSSP